MIRKIITPFGVVEYELVLKNIRRVNIKIKKDGKVIVSAPTFLQAHQIDNIVFEKSSWIKKQLAKCVDFAGSELTSIFLIGKKYQIEYHYGDNFETIVKMQDNIIYLYGKNKDDMLAQLRKKVMSLAKKFISGRFEYYSQMYAQTFYLPKQLKLSFANVKSWWGQYNASKIKITFSYSLISRPVECIDAIICHELAHIKVRNHQKEFYTHLNKLYPNYKECKKHLNDKKYYQTDNFIYNNL